MIPKSMFQRTLALAAIGISAGLLMSPLAFAGEETPGAKKTNVKNEEPKKVLATMGSSLNNESVRIYPDIIKRSMHVVAKQEEGKEITFFVFDLQGTLMENFKMKSKEHQRIDGLKRGRYIYRVFNGDLETASGQFVIR